MYEASRATKASEVSRASKASEASRACFELVYEVQGLIFLKTFVSDLALIFMYEPGFEARILHFLSHLVVSLVYEPLGPCSNSASSCS